MGTTLSERDCAIRAHTACHLCELCMQTFFMSTNQTVSGSLVPCARQLCDRHSSFGALFCVLHSAMCFGMHGTVEVMHYCS